MRAALPLIAALACAPALARAGEGDSPSWSLTAHAGAQGYLSDGRTMGGYGGGFGLQVERGPFLAGADAAYLFFIGNAAALRVSAGVQRPGLWSPALLLRASLLVGDQFTFFQPGGPILGAGPAFCVGLTAAPLRFTLSGAHVSVLQLGVGLGVDPTGLAVAPQLDVLEISIPL